MNDREFSIKVAALGHVVMFNIINLDISTQKYSSWKIMTNA